MFSLLSLSKFSAYMLLSIVVKTWLQSVYKVSNRDLLIVVTVDAENKYLSLKHILPLFCVGLLRHEI